MLTPDEETVVFNKTTTIPRLTQGLTKLIKARTVATEQLERIDQVIARARVNLETKTWELKDLLDAQDPEREWQNGG